MHFRMYLHGSGESSTSGWTATYDITGADVLQVVDWAQAQAGDNRTYAVALVYDDRAEEGRNPGYGRGLVWLIGMDGNDHFPRDALLVATQHRSAPSVTPEVDRMPPDVPSVPPELISRLNAAQRPR